MENYSHQSSGDSSPLSREIDFENHEEPPAAAAAAAAAANYKVKFMCSYGGKIQPRPHDNQLSYVGGDTKILSVDRTTTFSAIAAKLSSICDAPPSEICFKYQLPGEELDALISVTNDEDLEHLMLEYDRLNRSSPKPARLRIFLFPMSSKLNSDEYLFKEAKSDGSWFVDALNSVQFRPLDNSAPATPPSNPEPTNPDFLFGFDKAINYKVGDSIPNSANGIPDLNDQVAAGDPVAPIQSQMERFRIRDVEKSYEDVNTTRIYQSEYYQVQEQISPPPPQAVPVPMSANYWPDRPNYQVPGGIPADQQPIYLIQTPAGGVYHQNPSVRQMSGGAPPGAGQGYYSVPRMMPAEAYREQPAYNAVPPQPSSLIQQPRVSVSGMPPPHPPAPVTEQGYTQVSYVDGAGRPVYYTYAGGGVAPPPAYQVLNAAAGTVHVDGRGGGGVGMGVGVDSKAVGGKAPQNSSV